MNLMGYILQPLAQVETSVEIMQEAIYLLETAMRSKSAVEIMDTFYKWLYDDALELFTSDEEAKVVFYYTSSLTNMPAPMRTVRSSIDSYQNCYIILAEFSFYSNARSHLFFLRYPQFINDIRQYINEDTHALFKDDVLGNRVMCSPPIDGISQRAAWAYSGVSAACVHTEDVLLHTVNKNVAVSAIYKYKKDSNEPEIHIAINKLLELSFKLNHRTWWFNKPTDDDPDAVIKSWVEYSRRFFGDHMATPVESALKSASAETIAMGLQPDYLRLDHLQNVNDKIADEFFKDKKNIKTGKLYKECIDGCLVNRRTFLKPEFLESLGFVRIVQPPGFALFTTLAHQVGGLSLFSCAWNMATPGMCAGHVAKEFIVAAAVSNRKDKSPLPFTRGMTMSSVVMKAIRVAAASQTVPGRAEAYKKLKVAAALVQDLSAVVAATKTGSAPKFITHISSPSSAPICKMCCSPLAVIAYFKSMAELHTYTTSADWLDAAPCCGRCAAPSYPVMAMLGETFR